MTHKNRNSAHIIKKKSQKCAQTIAYEKASSPAAAQFSTNLHEEAVVLGDGHLSDAAQVLDLDVLHRVQVRFVSEHLVGERRTARRRETTNNDDRNTPRTTIEVYTSMVQLTSVSSVLHNVTDLRPGHPATEKRENYRPIKNQQLADFLSRNEETWTIFKIGSPPIFCHREKY